MKHLPPLRKLAVAVLALLFTCAFPLCADAHRVNVFAWVEGDTIHGETSYPSGKPVLHGMISVTDQGTGETLLSVETDDQGLFSFAIPDKARQQGPDLLLTLDAGVGHQNTWTVKASEYGSAPAGTAPTTPGAVEPEAETPPVATGVTQAELDALLERKLAPIRKSLAEMTEDRVTLTDVIGGLGWLMGIFGVLAWMKGAQARRTDASGDHS